MLTGLGTGTDIWMWPLLLSSYMVASGAIRDSVIRYRFALSEEREEEDRGNGAFLLVHVY